MSGKTGWLCYAKKSECDILYKKMKSKNVSLAVEIYPRDGTETFTNGSVAVSQSLKFIPVRGRKPAFPQHGVVDAKPLKFIPVRGRKRAALLLL